MRILSAVGRGYTPDNTACHDTVATIQGGVIDAGAWRKRRRGCNPDLRRGGLREICPGLLLSLAFLVPASAFAQQVIGEPRLLDGFEDATPWRVVTSNQIGRASCRARVCTYV